MNPQVTAAIVAGVVSLVVAIVTGGVTFLVSNRRAVVDAALAEHRSKVDRELAELNAKLNRELAEQKAWLDNKALFAAERVAHELLMVEGWEQRTFDAIKHRIGGFDDDKLRQILVQASAVRFEGPGPKKEELWGLIDRNRKSCETCSTRPFLVMVG